MLCFTATSAVCVTGLTVVDTATHWSPFGLVAIMVLIQLGGLGIMIFASLIGLVLARKMSVRSRLNAATEANVIELSDIRGLVRRIVLISLFIEGVTFGFLFARFTARLRLQHRRCRVARPVPLRLVVQQRGLRAATPTTSSRSPQTPSSACRSAPRSSSAASGSRCCSSCVVSCGDRCVGR